MKGAIASVVLLISACSNMAYENASGGGGAAPRATTSRGNVPDSYVVRSGDTLYAIAFRYGLDQRDLASWNDLRNPDQIIAGQRLALRPPGGSRSGASSTASTGTRPATSSGGSTSTAARPAAPSAATPPTAARPDWLWPTRGTIVSRFGERGVLTTGIGIAGTLGQDIVAAAPGRVVYSGSGLPDYGQLVIIEHNATWLSAYGHNQRVLVSQGQAITRGQKIAEMGPGPGGAPRLHFEIRRNGDPLDPVTMLPAGR
jgi:lipoprotein NlpD